MDTIKFSSYEHQAVFASAWSSQHLESRELESEKGIKVN
jgi:hypothetical protein